MVNVIASMNTMSTLLWMMATQLKINEIHAAVLTSDLFIPLWGNIETSTSTTTCQQLTGNNVNIIYNSISYNCASCPSNSNIDPALIDGLGNYVQCKCQNGYYSIPKTCYNVDASGNCQSFICTSCLTKKMVSYSDRSACTFCGNTTLGIDPNTNECQCPLNHVLVEADQFGNLNQNKSCHTCPTGKAVVLTNTRIAGQNYQANYYTCQSCPDSLMSMSVTSSGSGSAVTYLYSCTCPSGYSIVGVTTVGSQSCILSTNKYYSSQSTAAVVTYSSFGSVTSDTMLHYFANAATNCQYYGGPQNMMACQALANLCVLQLYDLSTAVCSTYQAVVGGRTSLTNNIGNWGVNLPWLQYASSSACLDTGFTTSVRLNDFYLQYVLSSYSMNGTWLGYQSLQTALNYCVKLAPLSQGGGGSGTYTKWQYYGTYTNTQYSCDLPTLMKQTQVFYELFLFDSNAVMYYPVPVRIHNMVSGGAVVNQVLPTGYFVCEGGDVLVRRFFLYDIVSGLTAGGSAPAVMRYASGIILEVALAGNTANIYSPVLTISYSEAQPSSFEASTTSSSTSSASVSFAAIYTMDLQTILNTIFGFFIAFVVICGITTYVRYVDWTRRNSRAIQSTVSSTNVGGVNMKVLTEIAVIIIHTWVLYFFPFLVLLSWFFYLFFKVQNYPSLILPPEANIYDKSSPYYSFVVMLYVLAFFQLGYIVRLIFKQSFADVHFIDWEPVRSTADKAAKNDASVSVWRSILVINEWVRLQTKRKIDIRFTLFFLGIIFYYLPNDATQQPNSQDKSPGVNNILLQFCLNTFWWIILSFGQFVVKHFFLQRCFLESPELVFIDVCTLAKISVLVLTEDYHGYYLHCRSPHQYADSSMNELIEMLHKEEAGLTVDRSLPDAPAAKDVQSFRVFLTGEFKLNFDRFYSPLRESALTLSDAMSKGDRSASQLQNSNVNFGGNSRLNGGNSFNRNSGGATTQQDQQMRGLRSQAPNERLYTAWRDSTLFLQQFVENNLNKVSLKRVIREPSYLEKLFYISPSMDLNPDQQPSIFVTDRMFQYTKVFFLGVEFDLLLMNILSYCLFDLWFRNAPTSILMTFLLDYLLCYMRHQIGKLVVSKKSMIDYRFLI